MSELTKSFRNVFSMAKQYAKEIDEDGHTNSAKWLREDIETATAEYFALKALISDLKAEITRLEIILKESGNPK